MIKVTDKANLSSVVDVVTFAADYLGIDGVEVMLIVKDSILDRFNDVGLSVNGLAYKTNVPNLYQIYLRSDPDEPIDLILCHEMIHISQYVRGDLSLDMANKVFTWKDDKYGSDIGYRSRPWEIEAMEGEMKLLEAYRKFKRQQRRGKRLIKKS